LLSPISSRSVRLLLYCVSSHKWIRLTGSNIFFPNNKILSQICGVSSSVPNRHQGLGRQGRPRGKIPARSGPSATSKHRGPTDIGPGSQSGYSLLANHQP
jgi:hypothetical protein